MDMLLFFHSLFRYVVLVLLVASVFFAFKGIIANTPILIGERKAFIFTMVACHIQLAMGFILYWARFNTYGSNDIGRFWKFEHMGTMTIAILLITLGRTFSKRAKAERKKQLMIGVFYLIGLLLILSMIPWPGTAAGLNRGWL
jgi:hypothetical protein